MKRYTFLNDDGEIIEQVIAENHDQATSKAQSGIMYSTDFYSEEIEDNHAVGLCNAVDNYFGDQ